MEDQGTIEQIEFLARSGIRARLLEILHQRREISRDQLREEFEASRVTVQRNLNSLVDRGWVKNTNHVYSIAPCGDLVAEGFNECHQKVRAADRLQPFLRWISTEDLDLDLSHLSDATVFATTKSDPYSPVNRHVETLRTATRVQAMLPSVGRDAAELTSRRAKDGAAEYELVVTEGCEKVLREDEKYARYIDEAVETAHFSVSVFEGEIPYYLGILDGTVQIGVEDDDGIPRALVESKSAHVREWADETISSYLDGARTFQ